MFDQLCASLTLLLILGFICDSGLGFTLTCKRFSIQNSRLFAVPSNSGKVRVRLLTDVKGQGKKGDIVFISAAMWTNVLAPKKQAEKISEEAIERETKENLEKEAARYAFAKELSTQVQELNGSTRVKIPRKVGGSGQLFGSVTKKIVLEAIRQSVKLKLPDDDKIVSVVAITAAKTSDEVEGIVFDEEVDEIRRSGIYQATVQLHPKVVATCEVAVVSESL